MIFPEPVTDSNNFKYVKLGEIPQKYFFNEGHDEELQKGAQKALYELLTSKQYSKQSAYFILKYNAG